MSPDDLDPSPPVPPAPDPRGAAFEDEDEDDDELPRRRRGRRYLELDDADDRELLYGREPTEDEILDGRGVFDGWW